MAALPYMPLFPADYLADTAHLTTLQHGAYLLLIMNYWQRGKPLPNDDARLARIVGMTVRNWRQIKAPIVELFETGNDSGPELRHSRVEKELARVSDKSLKSKKAAQASVERRFGERSPNVEPTDTHTDKEEKNKSARGRAVVSKPDNVSDQVWSDFLAIRKAKRAPLTETALGMIKREAEKAGWTVPAAIAECVGRGWQSFKSDWVVPPAGGYPPGHSGVPL